MNQDLKKLTGHTDQLLGCYLGFRRKYALLAPLAHDLDIKKQYGSGQRHPGFEVLRHTLFADCVQTLVNLAFDKHEQTPSVAKIVARLEDSKLRASLRSKYAQWKLPRENGSGTGVEIGLQAIEQERRDELAAQFDDAYKRMLTTWQKFSSLACMPSFRVIRNKITAHLELKQTPTGYELKGPALVNATGSDLRTAVELLEQIVDDLTLVVRGVGFMMEDAAEQFDEEGRQFWQGPS